MRILLDECLPKDLAACLWFVFWENTFKSVLVRGCRRYSWANLCK